MYPQVVFDECHKAKNLVPTGASKPSKTGLTVLQLQKKLPKARIVYCSATGNNIYKQSHQTYYMYVIVFMKIDDLEEMFDQILTAILYRRPLKFGI